MTDLSNWVRAFGIIILTDMLSPSTWSQFEISLLAIGMCGLAGLLAGVMRIGE